MLRTELIKPLPELLRANAERFGDKIAFQDATRQVTWAELERRTGRIAGALADLRLQTGDRVAICLGNRVETVEAYLATTRAGAIGVPLNPRVTDPELAYLLDDSGASVVITDDAHLDRIDRVCNGRGQFTVVAAGTEPAPAGVRSLEQMATEEPTRAPRDDLGLDDLAWMLYTSGTTGRPKGVLSTQRNCLWSVAACYVPVPGLCAEDRVVWPLPLFHSLSHIACVLGVTAVGASARLIDGLAADEVMEALESDEATFLAGVPTMYHHLVRAARRDGFRAPRLRMGLVGGSVTSAELRRSFEELFDVPLLDAYGSTETCGSITINWPTGARVAGSCGLPVPGLGVRVVDPDTGLDVPYDAEGEVWVRGPSVMAGYHNQPEATEAVLRDGWYRTGDLVRRDDSGYFTVTGRIKELIIRGGENIHPVEVEDVIRQVPGVADVAVAGKPHETLGEVPVAFVVPGPDGVDPAELLAFCREHLTHFKVPEELYEITEVPRTASGKVTRHLLLSRPALLRAGTGGHFDTLFRLEWNPLSSVTAPSAGPGHCVVTGPSAMAVAGRLRAAGLSADVVADADGLRDRAGAAPAMVILAHAEPGVPAAPTDDLPAAAGRLAAAASGWLADPAVAGIPLVLLTWHAVATTPDEDVPDPAQAAMWGWAGSVQNTHPGRLVVVDLPDDESSPACVPAVLAAGAAQAAVRSGTILLPRLARAGARTENTRLDIGRTVLLTGADGEPGAAIARHLVAGHGIRHLILAVGPDPAGGPVQALKAELTRLGARVTVERCALSDRDALDALLAGQKRRLGAVVHVASGAGRESEHLAEAVNLDAATRSLGLSAFLILSSVSGLLGGTAATAAEAAAAAALNAVAQCRHAAGQPAVALAYGAWEAAGAASAAPGIGALSTADGLAMLDVAVTGDRPLLAAMRLDVDGVGGPAAVPAPLLGLVEMPWQNAAPDGDRRAALCRTLAAMPPTERRHHLIGLVRTAANEALGRAGEAPPGADRSFHELGLTSVVAVALRDRLAAATGLRLPATLAFDRPTPAAVAERLLMLLTSTTAAPARTRPAAATAPPPDEPIAIVSMACRLPGGITSPDDLWNVVVGEVDAISEFPDDRGWDFAELFGPDPTGTRPGRSHTRHGGFLYDAAGFDAGFFGISPREALAMDPQQRVLLELSWELFERAGIDPDTQRGAEIAVFAGAMRQDYASGVGRVPETSAGYLDIGTAGGVVSGRISYTLGLQGPAVTVDTACSSSLVATHLAMQALRRGECTLALAGGVAIMASPRAFVEFSRQRALAPDGRCKAFAAAADGTAWSEGAGLLLLERLSDAHRNGHRVLATIRGSAVNQDGASNGMTAPSGPAQERVIRRALAAAGLNAADVDLVEAHGTGTPLGDPIEAQALLATYGQGRPQDEPVWLGSLKSNIGHAQAAAGVAGVIKAVQAMRHGVLPRTLHVDQPTPEADWETGAVALLHDARDWPVTGRPRRCAVSSFGVSGTNAHLILEGATEPASPPEPPRAGWVPWPISAASEPALRAQAGRLAEAAGGGLDRHAVARMLAGGRAALEHRVVILAEEVGVAVTAARMTATGRTGPSVITGRADVEGSVAFVFPGQGAQWAGMGRELLETAPVFAARLQECAEALSTEVDWSLHDVLRGVPGAPDLDRVDVVQPVTFAVMVSLAALWQSAGVQPGTVVGHSQGEVAAACVAGALNLADATRVVVRRARLIAARLAGRGGMAFVPMSPAEAGERLAPWGDDLSVAAVNGPASVIISGAVEPLDELLSQLTVEGVRAKRVPVDYASHSVQVESIEQDLKEALGGIRPVGGTVPIWSTVDNRWVDGAQLTGDYWYRNLRQPVRFAEATDALLASGYGFFLEVSAHPVLVPALREHTERAGARTAVVGTLRRDDGGPRRMLTSLAEAHVRGLPVDWSSLIPGPGPVADLPTYAFQHSRYWLAAESPDPDTDGVPPADRAFWAAVEREDVRSVTDAMAVTGDGAAERAVSPAVPVLAAWRRWRQNRDLMDSWRYRIDWRRLPGIGGAPVGRWLAVVPHGDTEAAVVRDALTAAGIDIAALSITPEQATRENLAGLLRDTAEPAGVLCLLGLDARPMPGHPGVTAGLAGVHALIAALGDAGVAAPMWTLTRCAVPNSPGGGSPRPEQALIWGFGLAAALEHPRRWGGLIDLPEVLDERAGHRLAAVLGGPEDQVAIRRSGAFGRRLVRAPLPAGDEPQPWRPRGTVLITGGTGGVAGHVARRLAAEGAKHLILVSRRGDDAPGAERLVTELRGLGARVTLAAGDIAERATVDRLLAGVPADRPLTAVVHAAGVGEFRSIDESDVADLTRIMAGKVAGAAHLDAALAGVPLDAFVLVSSNAGVWGAGGQAAYGAANAYLDALAARRRASGGNATSIAWGAWAGAGMSSVDGNAERLSRRGVLPMPADQAVAALLREAGTGVPTISVADVDWRRFAPAFTSGRPSPLLSELPEAAPQAPPLTEAAAPDRSPLDALPASARRAAFLDLIRHEAALVLGHGDASAIDPGRAFREQGFDSMTAVELRVRLVDAIGRALPSTVVFDHPSAAALAAHLAGAESTAPAGPAAPRPDDDDPIAIVAMSGRFPGGARTPEELWDLVVAAREAAVPFPTDRGWDLDRLFDPTPDRPGTSHVRAGGFLTDADRFDAEFFGISPREALAMDPQQRLLLESAWELLERAGVDPHSLRGSRTGVFAGAFHQGYGDGTGPARDGVEGYFVTGNALSVMSGRVAYTFGLEGPAVTVDTACSSSLVALHLAAQALRSGECDLAMAGGVTVMASPDGFVEFSRQRGLSADGRCRAFGAGADGTGWAEGVGVLLLERLSDARRNGHPVLALVRGSAVNSDGASNGLTAPNGPSQQRVIREALANGGLTAADVDLVEGHGTGTELGDPIEAHAVLATYGQGRDPDRPAWLGSLKSNLGHTQAAAGVAGVIKVVQAMRHGVLPRTLHAAEPSTRVDWESGAVRLLNRQRPWPDHGRPRRAAVSSFGISGTNAHVILEQAPAEPADTTPRTPLPVVPWLLAAKTPEGLTDQATRLLAATEGMPPANVGLTLTTRAALPFRAVVAAPDSDRLRAQLRELAAGNPRGQVVAGTPVSGRLAFLFTGQGAQRAGMGHGLYQAYPAFAEAFDETAAELDRHLDRQLADIVFGDDQGLLDRTEFTQPGLFAVEVALYRLLESWGVRPDVVAGHSIGELSAAHVAGVLTLADACCLVAARGRLMQELPGGGAMCVVEATEAELAEHLDGLADRVSIAAVNGPHAVVVSGDDEVVSRLVRSFHQLGRRTKRIRASHAFHSPHMEPMLDRYRGVVAELDLRPPAIPLVSTRTGAPASAEMLLSPDHWTEQVRQGVRFADAVRALHAERVSTYLELGPGGVLTAMVQDCLGEDADTVAAVPTLRRDRDEPEAVVAAVAGLHVRGVAVDWPALFAGSGARPVQLPTYPFRGRRYWLAPERTGDVGAAGIEALDHPLLTAAVRVPDEDGLVCTGRLGSGGHVWLRDHVVAGTVLVPGTCLIDLAARAGVELGYGAVDELIIEAPLVMPEYGDLQLRVTVGSIDATGRRPVRIHTGRAEEPEWTRHATGLLSPGSPREPMSFAAQWPPRAAAPVDITDFYARMAADGYEYGPPFQGLRAVWTRGVEIFAEVVLPDEVFQGAERHVVHPALLDAALHAASFGALDTRREGKTLLPFAWNGVTVHTPGSAALRLRIVPAGADAVRLEAAGPEGTSVVTVERLLFRPMAAAARPSSLFRVEWRPLPPGDPAPVAPAAVVDLTTGTDLLRRALDAAQSADDARVVLLTRNATTGNPDAAAVWGLIRSAQLEQPGRFVLVDLDDDPASRAAVADLPVDAEPQLAVRAGAAHVPRLARHTAADRPAALDPAGTVLITGGTGLIGGLAARRLVTDHGVRHLLLLSRSGPAAESADGLRAELAELGATVAVRACDAGDRDALAAALAAVPAAHPLIGVVHAAGVLDDGVLDSLSPERLATVWRPKADAARHLDELTRDDDLALFVLFSSAAGTLGSPGQSGYAAANAYLDALAVRRRSAGLPALSLAWGLWAQASEMTRHLGHGDPAKTGRGGMAALDSAEALDIFSAALGSPEPVLVPARLNLAGLAPEPAGSVSPLLRGLVRRRAAVRGRDAAAGGSQRERIAGLAPADRAAALLRLVRAEAAAALGHTGGELLEPERAFQEAGFDSLTAVDLRNRLTRATEVRLPAGLVFDHPNPVALAGHLDEQIGGTAGPVTPPVLAELDRLERLLAVAPDEAIREQVVGRLGRLAERWRPGTTGDEEIDLGSASDDELFDAIDSELGSS
ncbi:type I polyketide synthase [Actinoplanes sp. DH11]|uniref:type I polyketide synthase n=1 Tax=Actinoplanes sp. DH11 TaxID=2857011 RepID=UPI001E5FA94B|nr:type I polyketide synthase [Actinoplanes sp. DH11]